jgi:hypothetical protein
VKKLAPLLCLLLLAGAASACSSDDPADQSTANQPTVPTATGDSCADPVGDISANAKAAGVGTEPAGIDLVDTSADLSEDGEQLTVRFTTAGPITQTPGTTFVVAQGTPFTPLAFEMRAVADDDGTWAINIITWDTQERSTSAPVRPTIDANTLSFTVPMGTLPPLALYQQFGASAELDGVGRVIDDCSSLTTAPTVG